MVKSILFSFIILISQTAWSQSYGNIREASKKLCVVQMDGILAFGSCDKGTPLKLTISPDPSGELVTIRDANGKCLDFYFTNEAKSAASFNTCNNSGNQRFTVVKESGGANRFVYGNDSKLCLDSNFSKVRMGAQIILFPCDASSASQMFYED